MKYRCREKYKLELRWDKLDYTNSTTAKLIGAKFSGPVLKQAAKIEAPDHIDLDLTPQLLTVMDSYYIVRLSWSAVEYNSDGTVDLKDAIMANEHLRSLHKLQDKDFIIVNTEKHEEATHAFHLVYEAYVMRSDKTVYDYNKK